MSLSGPSGESPERPFRQVWPVLRRERGNPAPAAAHGMFRRADRDSPRVRAAIHVPGGVGPRPIGIERRVAAAVVAAGLGQPTADPLRNGYGHRVAEQAPTVPTGPLLPQYGRPTVRESLESFHRLDRGRHDPARRQEHGRRTPNRQRRPRLQRRNRIRRQAVAGSTLRPVKSDGARHVDAGRPLHRPGFVGEQHVPGIAGFAGDDEHAASALSKAERTALDDAVRPPVTALLQVAENVRDGRSAPQMQHEVDVLDDDPPHGTAIQQVEQPADDRALPTLYSPFVAGHGQVLARKTGRDYLGVFRQIVEGRGIPVQPHVRPAPPEHLRRVLVVLAQQERTMTRTLESQLEAADSGEQTCNAHDRRVVESPAISSPPDADRRLDPSIERLHRACGVYTIPAVATGILDAVGWRADVDLSAMRLLEPAAGNGEFVVQAAKRLIESCRARGIEPTTRLLRPRITAFELHPGAASEARLRIRLALRELGVHHATALRCAAVWVRTADFLLSKKPTNYTHVVGNPPYMRWSKIPVRLKSIYEKRLPRHAIRGDLFLPFLDCAFELLQPEGRCGFLCSDRWMYMAFAQRFRRKWLPWLDVHSNDRMDAAAVFERRVDAYPTILIASKRATPKPPPPAPVQSGWRTLGELGCTIKAGPALGHTPAFVLEPGEEDVEPELLAPWVHASEILDGSIAWRSRRVIAMFTDAGDLVDLRRYPRLQHRLKKFLPDLSKRAIVRRGAPWYRTIDRAKAVDWRRPKLLVPELAKVPRVAIDRSGAVPSHGVYAIFAPGDRVDELYDDLRDGRLARALEGIAPRLKGNYVRCYKRFLSRVRVPIHRA